MRARDLTACLVAGLTLCNAALAQDDASDQVAAPVPCSEEIYRGFDFWLGTWEVTDAAGTVQGRNIITSEEGGCLILERWTSANGGTGQSYNFIEPETGTWRQVWVSSAANIDYSGGITEAGMLRLEGTITYRNGTQFPFAGEWTPQDDGTVRQYFEQYNPETKSWSPWFLGIYRRIEAADATVSAGQ